VVWWYDKTVGLDHTVEPMHQKKPRTSYMKIKVIYTLRIHGH